MALSLFVALFLLLFLGNLGIHNKTVSLVVLLEVLIESIVLFSLFILVSTELLSSFSAISYLVLIIVYSTFLILLLLLNIKLWRYNDKRKAWLNIIKFGFHRYKLLLSVFIIISVVPIFLSLILYPPNNWDSMTYHLSRVEHWIQNKNLSDYPTNIERQLFSQPFSEYVVLHLRILTGGDLLSALGQYVSFFGTSILIFLITNMFLKSFVPSILASIVALFVPMGILQASSTQTDLVASFFTLAFIYYGIKSIRNILFDRRALVFCSISFGMLVLTKYSGVSFCLSFLIWFSFSLLKRKSIKNFFLSTGLVFFAIVALNSPFLYRNWAASGSILSPKDMISSMRNEDSIIEAAFSNTFRNYAIQLNTTDNDFNSKMAKAVNSLLGFVHIDPNDPKNTWPGTSFSISRNTRHEDTSGSLLVYLIFPFSCIALLISKRMKGNILKVFILCIDASFIIFSVVFKWQPWGTRLMLPFSMLACIVIGISFELLPKRIAIITTAVFVVAGLPFAFSNATRPLLSISPVPPFHRYEQYFVNQHLENDFDETLSRGFSVLKPSTVLISSGEDSFEYPLWTWFRSHQYSLPKIYTPAKYAEFVPRNYGNIEEPQADWYISIDGKLPGPEWKYFTGTSRIMLFFKNTPATSNLEKQPNNELDIHSSRDTGSSKAMLPADGVIRSLPIFVSFLAKDGIMTRLKNSGFSDQESWGTWSASKVVTIQFAFADPLPSSLILKLNFHAMTTEKHFQHFEFLWNGKSIGGMTCTDSKEIIQNCDISGLVSVSNTFTIKVPNSATPKSLGLGQDTRELGIALVSIEFCKK